MYIACSCNNFRSSSKINHVIFFKIPVSSGKISFQPAVDALKLTFAFVRMHLTF